ncbi:MAG: HepT-like ribonuclease domain-containing protein [Cyanobacteria bacterium P01_D01_bin.1]
MNRDHQSLLDMMQSAEIVLAYMENVSQRDFYSNVNLQDSVIRRLLVIGEAANRVSKGTRMALPSIEWHKIRGNRNRLIHDYDDIDLAIVWKTVQEQMKPLISEIKLALPPDDQMSLFD